MVLEGPTPVGSGDGERDPSIPKLLFPSGDGERDPSIPKSLFPSGDGEGDLLIPYERFSFGDGGGVAHLIVLDLFWKQGGCLGPEEHNLCLPCAPSSPGVSVQCSLESLCSDSGESRASMPNALFFNLGGRESICE